MPPSGGNSVARARIERSEIGRQKPVLPTAIGCFGRLERVFGREKGFGEIMLLGANARCKKGVYHVESGAGAFRCVSKRPLSPFVFTFYARTFK